MKKNKRKLKKPLIIIALLVVAIASGAFIGYQVMFRGIDPDIKAEIDQEMDDITKDVLESIHGSMDSSAEGNEGEEPSGEGVTGSGQEGSNSYEDKKISNVLAAYEGGFEKLEGEGNSIVVRLLDAAKADYKTMKENGAGKIELAKIATSYINRANVMEAGMDSSVEMLTTKMKEDLVAAGMDEKEAKEVVAQAKSEYKKQKEERRKTLLSKAKEYL